MGPRRAFMVSLGVACSLHALFLLVPRPSGRIEEKVPAVELSLESAHALNVGPMPGPTALTRASTAKRAAAVEGMPMPSPLSPAFPEPAASSEKSEASLPPVKAEPAAGAAGANDDAAPSCAGAGGPAAPATDGPGTDVAAALVPIPAHPKAEILATYPRSASSAGFEGIARIMATIDESGVLISAEIISSSGYDALDKAALQAVRRAHFEPALQAGKSVPWHLIIPVRFKLN